MDRKSHAVLIASYGLCHPDWSHQVIVQEIGRTHNVKVTNPDIEGLKFFFQVTKKQVRLHRDKGQYLKIEKPESRGRKRKLSDVESQKAVKRELKKRKASPGKVAKILTASPKFKGSLSRSTIYRSMGKSAKSNSIILRFPFSSHDELVTHAV